MALIQCPKCGKDVSDKAESCPRCGYPIRKKREKNAWVKARMAFAIVNLVYGSHAFLMFMDIEGELAKDFSMAGLAGCFFLCCGILQLIGIRRRGFTIATIVFYSLGIMYNLIASLISPLNFCFASLMTIFLIFTAISLNDPKSFQQKQTR